MKIVAAIAVAVAAIVVVIRLRSEADAVAPIDRLQHAIEGSNLPIRAKEDMHALLADGRLRPSQYLNRLTAESEAALGG